MKRAPRILRVLTAAVPLTLRGLLLFAVSVGILALGIARTDMAGLFWGASFLIASLYAIGGNHLMSLILSRAARKVDFLKVRLPARIIPAGEETEAQLQGTMPRLFVPGFSVRFRLPLEWHVRSIQTVRATLSPGKNEVPITFTPRNRGRYRASRALLEVRDILGLTSKGVSLPMEESVKVFPRLPLHGEPIMTMDEGGDSVRYKRTRRRSEELLEVRKYFPGDDPRKINWKLFAHSSELFLRIGEETPPPESRFLFILDSSANPLVPARGRADFLDGLVEASALAMTMLLNRGTEVFFWWPGTRRCRLFDAGSSLGLMGLLSDVWWTGPEWTLDPPTRRGIRAIVFSSPGSPSLKRIMDLTRAKRWKTSLYLQDFTVRAKAPRAIRVRDLLLLPHDGERRKRAFSPRILTPFRDAMAEASARYAAEMPPRPGAGRGGQ
jgi:uncharacterized protein (DUF58 family)